MRARDAGGLTMTSTPRAHDVQFLLALVQASMLV